MRGVSFRTVFVLLGWILVVGWATAAGDGLGTPINLAASEEPTSVPTPPSYKATIARSDGGDIEALKDPKLSSALVFLADASARAQATGSRLTTNSPRAAFPRELQGLMATRDLRLTEDGEVQVFVLVDNTSAPVIQALQANGAQIERVQDKHLTVQALIPANQLRQTANLSAVQSVRLPEYPVVQSGSEQTEGDSVINSDDVRSAFGVDGTGVTVGVISDGVGGLAASQASGDLPSGGAMDTTTCNTFGGDPGAAGAEGTAMLEIIHDVAPGANLLFGNFGFATVFDFNDAVNCLAANADVVVDDIGWFNVGPYDGSSIVSQNTASALNGPGPIRGYYTSVGNDAQSHYQENFEDSLSFFDTPPNHWGLHEFDITGGAKGTKNARGTAPLPFNGFVLAPGGSASILLQWDDSWGSSSNDYDLLYGVAPDIFPCGLDSQDGVGSDDFPRELCALMNPTDSIIEFDIFIGNWAKSAAPVEFDMFLNCSGCLDMGNGNALDFNTSGSSVSNQADAAGSPAPVISVGAVPHSGPSSIEPFSSLGLTNDGRLKPEISAPDGVSVTGNGGFPSTFFGTSAAAPHVAAVAALLLECDPSLDRIVLKDRLLDNAVDLGVAGPDNTYGFGRVDALASASKGCGAAPTSTPTATATPTPSGPTPTPTKQPAPGDTDGDGCSDQRENGPDANQGGRRNYLYEWDFYDVNGDLFVNIPGDIFAVAEAFGRDDPDYTPQKDRSPGPPPGVDPDDPDNNEPWDLGPPDGVINIPDDILGVARQFGHRCA